MSSNDEAKRAAGRAAEQALLKQGKEYYALLQAESAKQPSSYLAYLCSAFSTFVPGLSPALFLLGSVGSTSARSRPLASCLLWAWAAAERMLRQRNLDFLAPPCKRCWRRLAAQL